MSQHASVYLKELGRGSGGSTENNFAEPDPAIHLQNQVWQLNNTHSIK